MTEQHEGEHEWVPRVLDWEDVDGARCSIPFCDAQMDNKEMSRRLNATERLSAEDAREVAYYLPVTIWKHIKKRLCAYADTLEGKDE